MTPSPSLESSPPSAGDAPPLAQMMEDKDSNDGKENYVVSANNPPAPHLTAESCNKDKGESKKLLMTLLGPLQQ
jgi:hypothetical protein